MSKKKRILAAAAIFVFLLLLAGVSYLENVRKMDEVKAQAAVSARIGNYMGTVAETFADTYILTGITLTDAQRTEYINVCEKMFQLVRYETQGAVRQQDGTYLVSVQYEGIDVYKQFLQAVEEHSEEFLKDAKNEEYKSKNKNTISNRIRNEYIAETCQLLKDACGKVTYSEPQTIEFTVKKVEDGEFVVDDEKIDQFALKILHIDEIQD